MKQRRTIASFRRDTARRLRSNATGAEARLWWHLRRSPIIGSHFRRQVPIGRYVADFACLAARLIIEVDGSPARMVQCRIARRGANALA